MKHREKRRQKRSKAGRGQSTRGFVDCIQDVDLDPDVKEGIPMAFTTLYGKKLTQVMGMEEPAWQENTQLKKKKRA